VLDQLTETQRRTPVVPLRPAGDTAATAAGSLAVLGRHLDRRKLATGGKNHSY
jgi:hypothetical protein